VGLWYRAVRGTVRSVFFGLRTGGLRGIHESRVPGKGAVILAANHMSHLDPPAVGCATRRELTFMAKKELFKGLFGKIIASLGAFPVSRGEGDTESIRHSMELLEQGHALLLFPEGTRGDGKTLQELNRGVAMLAKRTGAPVVPVGVVGTEIVLPRGAKKMTRHPIKICFGEPFTYDAMPGATDREKREAFTAELASRIVALCRENGFMLASSAAHAGRAANSPTISGD